MTPRPPDSIAIAGDPFLFRLFCLIFPSKQYFMVQSIKPSTKEGGCCTDAPLR